MVIININHIWLILMDIVWLMMVNNDLVGGFNLPLWKMMEFVSWDDDIPNWMEKLKKVPNHQPVMFGFKLGM